MKIILVSDNLVGYHKYWSGAEMVTKILSDSLQKEGQKVFFFTTKVQNKENLQEVCQIPTMTGKARILQKLFAPIFIFLGFLVAVYYLKKIKPDVIDFMHSNYLFIPVMAAASFLKIPTVFTFLDYYMICPRATFRMSNGKICESVEGNICFRCISKLKYAERVILRKLKNKLDGVITFTETSKKRLKDHGFSEDRIRVIYIYNLPSEFSKMKTKKIEEESILVVASFNEHKGLHVALKVMPFVISEFPSVKMRIIGQGNKQDTERITELIDSLGIAKHVDFLGQKSNEEVLRIISEHKIIVVPEQWPSEFGPLALVEAMALGRPVVAADIGSAPDFIKDGKNGLLVKHNSPENFAKKINKLLKNSSEAERMGKKAREAGKTLFSYNQGKDTIDFFKEIIKSK
ncbi:MAG: glycosyltransferase family 4 protein [Candidatus Nealsonbacteria bacterium]